MHPLLLALGLVQAASALDAAGWRQQIIYQVITDRFAQTDGSSPACDSSASRYCNGTWKGITNHLDYIQNLGATAVWISPVVKNVEGVQGISGEAYHGFWAQDLYSLNPHFGDEADLKALSDALHARGMYLMVDVVPNHMSNTQSGKVGDYSGLVPFNDTKYYHPRCGINWNDLHSKQICWLYGLPDLRTEDEDVRKVFREWFPSMVKKYGIDGLRIDAGVEVEPEFWTTGGMRQAAGVFTLGEVYTNFEELQLFQPALDGVLDYPTWQVMVPAFASVGADMSGLFGMQNKVAGLKTAGLDPSLWASFVENQDQTRFAFRTEDQSLAKNVAAFSMLRDGIPIVYAGQEKHYHGGKTPENREAIWLGAGYDTSTELYQFFARLAAIRKRAAGKSPTFLTTDRARAMWFDPGDHAAVLALRKGQMLSLFTNGGNASKNAVEYIMSKESSGGFPEGQDLVDVINCHRFQVDSQGHLHVLMPDGGMPRVFLPADQVDGLCANVTEPAGVAQTSKPVRRSVHHDFSFVVDEKTAPVSGTSLKKGSRLLNGI